MFHVKHLAGYVGHGAEDFAEKLVMYVFAN